MRKSLSILIICLLVFICNGCSQDSSDEIAVLTYRLEQAEAAIAALEERLNDMETAEVTMHSPSTTEDLNEAKEDTEVTSKTAPTSGDNETILLNSLKSYQNTSAYIKYAFDDMPMELQFATEYSVSNLEGHKVNVILATVNADREIYGIDVGHVLIDLEDGTLYHCKTLDVNNFRWENISSYEDALTGVFACYTSWISAEEREPFICTDMEYREDFTPEQLDRINSHLN